MRSTRQDPTRHVILYSDHLLSSDAPEVKQRSNDALPIPDLFWLREPTDRRRRPSDAEYWSADISPSSRCLRRPRYNSSTAIHVGAQGLPIVHLRQEYKRNFSFFVFVTQAASRRFLRRHFSRRSKQKKDPRCEPPLGGVKLLVFRS